MTTAMLAPTILDKAAWNSNHIEAVRYNPKTPVIMEMRPAFASVEVASMAGVEPSSLLKSIPSCYVFEREVEILSTLVDAMGEVRFAIAGDPVAHSLSPLLLGLVHAHLLSLLGQKEVNLKIKSLDLVPSTTIEGALAWGYAGAVPSAPEWEYTQAPFGKFRTTTLMQKAIDAGMAIEDSEERFEPVDDQDFTFEAQDLDAHPQPTLPTGFFGAEIWVNLTSPLKHQLSSDAVSAIDASMENQCVNALRWDGQGWWCAGLDGAGAVALAQHFGITFDEAPVLSLCGGGGAARSVAASWLDAGGAVHAANSRRTLPEDLLLRCTASANEAVFGLNFDSELNAANAPIVVNAAYQPLTGDLDSMMASMIDGELNGRWLLVAQHLACWKTLWAPHLEDFLPSIDLLLTRLIHAEAHLHHYA